MKGRHLRNDKIKGKKTSWEVEPTKRLREFKFYSAIGTFILYRRGSSAKPAEEGTLADVLERNEGINERRDSNCNIRARCELKLA